MLGVETDPEQRRGDRGEDQELHQRNAGNLRPETNYQRRRATNDQDAADDLAPAHIALLHERREHFREWFARRFQNRRDRLRVVGIFRPRAQRRGLLLRRAFRRSLGDYEGRPCRLYRFGRRWRCRARPGLRRKQGWLPGSAGTTIGKEHLFALTFDLCFEDAKIDCIQRAGLMKAFQLPQRAFQFAKVLFLRQ